MFVMQVAWEVSEARLLSAKHKAAIRRGFTLVELAIVVLILGVLAAVAYPKVINQSDDSQVTTVRLSLQTIQDQLDMQYALTGEYPATIEASWFRHNKIPHHPYNDGSIPDIHVFTGHDRIHPSHKTLDNFGAYWYNRDNGIVRARVPYTASGAEIVRMYNLLNQAEISSPGQMYND